MQLEKNFHCSQLQECVFLSMHHLKHLSKSLNIQTIEQVMNTHLENLFQMFLVESVQTFLDSVQVVKHMPMSLLVFSLKVRLICFHSWILIQSFDNPTPAAQKVRFLVPHLPLILVPLNENNLIDFPKSHQLKIEKA